MNNTLTRQEEGVMLQQIWNELRYVRAKLDSHISKNNDDFKEMKKDVSEVKSEIGGHKIKLGLIFSAIGLVIAGLVSWVFDHISNGSG